MKRRILLLFAAIAAASPLLAQDLNERRGFRVKITTPSSGAIVAGPTMIRAEVESPREGDIKSVRFLVNDKVLLIDTEAPYQVEYDFGHSDQQHVIRVIAEHVDGPKVSDFVITRTLDLKYFVNVQRVILNVSVRDGHRRVVTGLGAEDFAVSEDGKTQRIVQVSTETRPILVGMLVDSSGSMRDRMDEARDGACAFMDTLREEDRAFVIDFDERVYLIEETTHDFEKACKSLSTAEPVGGTALYDALHAAFRVIYEPKAERRAFVILSDGDDSESRITLDGLIEEARLADVTIYAIGLGSSGLSSGRSALKRLARETGGRAFFIKKAEDLASTYAIIAEELRTLYQLVYASDNETFDGRFMKVRVKVEGGEKLDIQHRRGYFATAR